MYIDIIYIKSHILSYMGQCLHLKFVSYLLKPWRKQQCPIVQRMIQNVHIYLLDSVQAEELARGVPPLDLRQSLEV